MASGNVHEQSGTSSHAGSMEYEVGHSSDDRMLDEGVGDEGSRAGLAASVNRGLYAYSGSGGCVSGTGSGGEERTGNGNDDGGHKRPHPDGLPDGLAVRRSRRGVKRFRLRGKSLYCTYPRNMVSLERIGQNVERFFEGLGIDFYVVCDENHSDGGAHRHIFVQLRTAADITGANTLDILVSEYDGDPGKHGNYQVAKSMRNVVRYMAEKFGMIQYRHPRTQLCWCPGDFGLVAERSCWNCGKIIRSWKY